MKQLTKFLLAIALTSVIAVITASAQGAAITVDELGNGNIFGTSLPSSMKVDPFSGITTLAYQLPFPGVPGDVYLLEANNPGRVSDVIRFDGNFSLYFFSDNDGPPIDPADVGLPPPVTALPIVSILEVGPEGNNGAYYNAGFFNPGGNSVGADYMFISDVVPEPATLALATLAGGLLIRRRRSRSSGITG